MILFAIIGSCIRKYLQIAEGCFVVLPLVRLWQDKNYSSSYSYKYHLLRRLLCGMLLFVPKRRGPTEKAYYSLLLCKPIASALDHALLCFAAATCYHTYIPLNYLVLYIIYSV